MAEGDKFRVEARGIDEIAPYENNPRNNAYAVDKVAQSIRKFGWQQPIVVDIDGVIVAGHTRYEAAKRLGLDTVPVHVAKDLTPEEIQAYRLADNKTAELSTWDFGKLRQELDGITSMDMQDFGFFDAARAPEERRQAGTGTAAQGGDAAGFGQQAAEGGAFEDGSGKYGELDVDDFAEENYDHKCPRCGMLFND